MANLIISLRDAGIRRSGRDVLTHVSLVATSGEFIAVLGPSGSGKSTLLKTLLGLNRLSSGHVLVNGKARSPMTWRHELGYVPQDDVVPADLRVEQALRFAARLRLPPEAVDRQPERVMRQLGIWEQRRQRIRTLSGGQRKRVSIACELLSDPALLVLDEPTSGLDPGLEAALMRQLAAMAKAGLLVIATTHAMASLDQTTRVLVVHGGHLIYDGSPVKLGGYFGVASPEAVFAKLAERPAVAWVAEFARRRRELRP